MASTFPPQDLLAKGPGFRGRDGRDRRPFPEPARQPPELPELPELLFVPVDEPLFVCDTVTVLELLDDAAPLVTVADDVPVFEPELVFEAVPPVLSELDPPPP